VGGRLFVPDEDVSELRVLGQDVIKRKNGPAGVAKHHVDALFDQRLADHLRAGSLHSFAS
jgi:hypothetical protein